MRFTTHVLGASVAAALCTAAATLEAQMPLSINGPKRAATRAAAATDAHTTAMTSVPEPETKPRAGTAQRRVAKAAAATTTPGTERAAKAATAPGRAPRGAGAAAAPAPERRDEAKLTVHREAFGYSADGRRDPFFSLLNSSELCPMLSDLRLVAVVYDPGGRSVAMLRDLSTKEQYRARVGQTLGRMRVSQIHPKSITFTLEELGFSRQEVLALNDSTTARKQ